MPESSGRSPYEAQQLRGMESSRKRVFYTIAEQKSQPA
jgi:hypothetical protein